MHWAQQQVCYVASQQSNGVIVLHPPIPTTLGDSMVSTFCWTERPMLPPKSSNGTQWLKHTHAHQSEGSKRGSGTRAWKRKLKVASLPRPARSGGEAPVTNRVGTAASGRRQETGARVDLQPAKKAAPVALPCSAFPLSFLPKQDLAFQAWVGLQQRLLSSHQASKSQNAIN